MNSTLTKIQAAWVALGSFLIVTGVTGKFPWLADIFSQAFVNATVTAIGAVVTFYQFVRAIFAAKSTDFKVLSTGSKFVYALNPFKLAA